jgi:hypothetical protein
MALEFLFIVSFIPSHTVFNIVSNSSGVLICPKADFPPLVKYNTSFLTSGLESGWAFFFN